jgi:phosphohistidine swiveling domain-containing protein
MKHQPLIKKLRAGLKADETGNKANSLIFLHHYGFNIPLTYLVTTVAYTRYLSEGSALVAELAKEIDLLPERTYAVRSSTTAEDSGEYSFAGQFQTLINVSGTESIIKAVQSVWDSVALLNNSEYLKRTNVSEIRCGVIIQEMIPSLLAGVSFSRNPVTDQNETVIEAVEAAGEELVQKGLTPMRWRIRKELILEGNEQYKLFPVVKQVARDTARLRRYYGQHIDIEWVYDGKLLYYLQLRQITGRKEVQIYSNKMAKEMLPGQIKPMVWSVNIPLVNGTWIRLLSEITGPLSINPEELARPFYYQTYFNIAALGKIFSEFGMSPDSLERLMTSTGSGGHSFKPGIRTLKHSFRIIRFLNSKLHFEKRFLEEYSDLKIRYTQMSDKMDREFTLSTYPGIFAELFETGQRLVYLNIVTPMLATMYHKSLSKKLKKLNLDYEKLDFRHDFPQLEDYEPLPLMQSIRKEIDRLPPEIREKCTSLSEMSRFSETGQIREKISQLLQNFGHLSESGNDFSYPKWKEEPETVFGMIMSSEGNEKGSGLYTYGSIREKGTRTGRSLNRSYMKAGRFKLYREQISSLYIFGYGLFRRLFLHLGKEMASRGILLSADDIFYLTKEEADSIVSNINSIHGDEFSVLAEKRRLEMEETRDIVLPPVIYGDEAPLPETGRSRNHSGTGTSPGIFTGVTRVVKGIRDFAEVKRGDVLLIPFSDVSWTPVLARAGAIVSETGGMLSHCSIIAREMGIPALVSVPNACALGNGLTATVNGSNGVLTIHDYE